MDHDTVVRQKMAERYLLDELEPGSRDEFEEHYFDCPECAADVHAGALFVDGSKVLLAQSKDEAVLPIAHRVVREEQRRHGWFDWLRPALAVPVFALLLAVIGYQAWNYQLLQQSGKTPQVLASAVVNLNVRGVEPVAVPVSNGNGFGLTLNLPPGQRFSSYKLDLYSAQGKLEWSQTVQATGSDSIWLYVPANDQAPAMLAAQGINSAGESQDLGRYPIELQSAKH